MGKFGKTLPAAKLGCQSGKCDNGIFAFSDTDVVMGFDIDRDENMWAEQQIAGNQGRALMTAR